jgi:predicted ATPase
MFFLNVKIKIPFLWGKEIFKKNSWSHINLILGPNGSGKSILAKSIQEQFSENGFKVSYFQCDKITDNNEQPPILSNQLKHQIQEIFSSMFAKSLRFDETPDGKQIPIIYNKERNSEYSFSENEYHGLREIITLLLSLYLCKSDCIIFDEPELHMHPQFQLFFMSEIRKISKQNPKKIFFIITHSPFFVDLKQPNDLIGVIVCHVNRAPTHIDELNKDDRLLLKRFLPRFNSYHKQFFFSDNQIFVEGYTDQQMFSYLLPFVKKTEYTTGTGIIDVGGKDELGVFFKVCTLLGTNARIITDLDSLFSGKLIEVVENDKRPFLWLEKQYEKQLSFYQLVFTKKEISAKISLTKLIQKLESLIIEIGDGIHEIKSQTDKEMSLLIEKIDFLHNKYDNVENLDTYKTVVLQGITQISDHLELYLPLPLAKEIPIVKNLASLVFAAIETARVYILQKGCIEHYYTQNISKYMPISGKDKLFHAELEYLTKEKQKNIKNNYQELIILLNNACCKK